MFDSQLFNSLPGATENDDVIVNDVIKEMAEISNEQPRTPYFEELFLARRLHEAKKSMTDAPDLLHLFSDALISEVHEPKDGINLSRPVPGGVGYGMFYERNFQYDFSLGTAKNFCIICPTRPGGNVSTWLYLTAMNRAAKGVEAFILYNGQDEMSFRVFDWARTDQWQINLPYSAIKKYLFQKNLHGAYYQMLQIMNITQCIDENTWQNSVYLHVQDTAVKDLVYQYTYKATLASQKDVHFGSWGPIVETFQDNYSNTDALGFYNCNICSQSVPGSWNSWNLLNSGNSYLIEDRKGFRTIFRDQNHSFAVH